MLAAMRTFAQNMANSMMVTPVVIRHRAPADKDADNPYGDDTSEYELTSTAVLGWFIDPSSATFTNVGGMSAVVDKPTLRLPVGTRVDTRDQVQINGNWWVVTDASADETWPAMLKVGLVREQ